MYTDDTITADGRVMKVDNIIKICCLSIIFTILYLLANCSAGCDGVISKVAQSINEPIEDIGETAIRLLLKLMNQAILSADFRSMLC